MHVPTEAEPRWRRTGRPQPRGGQPWGEVRGGGADFDINQYTVYGADVTKTALGPLTSSKITSGRGFETTETNATVVIADAAYAKTKKYEVGSEGIM